MAAARFGDFREGPVVGAVVAGRGAWGEGHGAIEMRMANGGELIPDCGFMIPDGGGRIIDYGFRIAVGRGGRGDFESVITNHKSGISNHKSGITIPTQ